MTGAIQIGMSREQLRAVAGPPVRVREAPPGGLEMWRYRRPGQRRLRLRTTWVEFEFKDGALAGNRVYADSARAVAVWYVKVVLVVFAAFGIVTISRIATDRSEGQRLRIARDTLRPGMTKEEVAVLFNRKGVMGGHETASWAIDGRAVDRLFGDLYVIDGEFVRAPASTKTKLWIDFKNDEVVEWREIEGP